MPFTHHSHSGQFCGHAKNSLKEVIEDAIAKGMTSMCLTEHIPRERIDFYPEEENIHTEESLAKLYDDFFHEAGHLQAHYADQINLFVGFEGEWIRDSSQVIMNGLLDEYAYGKGLNIFVGSVHHVHTIPIDFDEETYHRARADCVSTPGNSGNGDEIIAEHYFDAQYEMLQRMHPPLVGHFDLIRLYSDDPSASFKPWKRVWSAIMRNLQFVMDYGGVLEINGSALRKGMSEAYPQVEICQEFVKLGGRFTLSDDSHGVEQVGLNYHRVLECIKKAGIEELVYLAKVGKEVKALDDERFPNVGWKTMSIEEVERHGFWRAEAQKALNGLSG